MTTPNRDELEVEERLVESDRELEETILYYKDFLFSGLAASNPATVSDWIRTWLGTR